MKRNSKPRFWYRYMTDEVAARASTDEMLLELVLAIVWAAADYDMYATGKASADTDDYVSAYRFFRGVVDKLGIPPQAIIDSINGCCPDNTGGDLTESVEEVPCTPAFG